MNAQVDDTKYKDFLASLESDEHVIILQAEDGIASCASNTYVDKDTEEPITVIPVWSSAYAKDAEANLTDDWSEYDAVELPMEVFLTELLPYLAQEGVFIGVNWDVSLEGMEVDPLDVFKDLGLLEEGDEEDDEDDMERDAARNDA
ncbi:MAG: DUF2750 domain-containing protein [Alphaproteobacteria bacterium]|nr:DUF2750 domain-containing protein [Alphaproteobacteria bacterium]